MKQIKYNIVSGMIGLLSIAALVFILSRKDSSQNFSKTTKEVTQQIEVASVEKQETALESKASDPIYKSRADLSANDEQQLKIVQEIFDSKNDNDPRLDNELKNVSKNLKSLLIDYYHKIPAERKNEKGTIVYLISRQLQSARDIEFLNQVYGESPCLSLSDCSKSESSTDPHHSSMNEVTLNYQQIVGLYQIEKQLEQNSPYLQNPQVRSEIRGTLEKAKIFGVGRVQSKAQEIIDRFGL